MSKFLKHLKNKEYYEKLFNTWVPYEQHIDEEHDIWRLQSPEYKSEFVAMYRDGYRLFIYGSYGNLIFDQMTWKGNPHNLAYESLDYQMGKLSHDCYENIHVFDSDYCREDIIKWFNEQINDNYNICDKLYDEIDKFLKIPYNSDLEDYLAFDVDEIFADDPDYDEILDDAESIKNLAEFVSEALNNTDKYEWISFLRRSNLDEFEEVGGSFLWNAGERINQKFYINLYAMYILSEKLKNHPKRNG